MNEYKSSIKQINASREDVYNKLSNLENFNSLVNMLPDDAKYKLDIRILNQDECQFNIKGAGNIVFKIIEKEPHKTIKFEAQSSPIPLTMWIQLIEPNINDTRLRITLHTKLNFMIKKMIGNKLEDGVEKIATILTSISY